MQNTQLCLIIPAADVDQIRTQRAELSALKLMLNRADSIELKSDDFAEVVAQLFELDAAQAFPAAAITGLADGLPSHTDYWLRADPVQLQADLSSVYLIGNDALVLNESEIQSLKAELQALFAQDGLVLHTPDAKRWYLQSSTPLAIITQPLNSMQTKNIADALPTGTRMHYWRRLMTEAQMVLHNSEVNRLRAGAGQLTLNGLWLWGEGPLPHVEKSPWQTIYAQDALIRGLALLHKVTPLNPPEQADEIINSLQNNARTLISLVPATPHDLTAWLQQLERNWFKPLLKALRKKQIQSLSIYLGGAKIFNLDNRSIHYFWRRRL